MRKKAREMNSQWALEVMRKAPFVTVSFIDESGKPYGLPLSIASDDDAIARSLSHTVVVRITIDSISGKRKQYDKQGEEMKYGRME